MAEAGDPFPIRKAAGAGSRTFSFGGMMTKSTTNEIVDFGEPEGVKVEREARFKIVRP